MMKEAASLKELIAIGHFINSCGGTERASMIRWNVPFRSIDGWILLIREWKTKAQYGRGFDSHTDAFGVFNPSTNQFISAEQFEEFLKLFGNQDPNIIRLEQVVKAFEGKGIRYEAALKYARKALECARKANGTHQES
jgi:hypothetical protein